MNDGGPTRQARNRAAKPSGGQPQDDMPGMLTRAQEQARPMPERGNRAGSAGERQDARNRNCVAVSSLRLERNRRWN